MTETTTLTDGHRSDPYAGWQGAEFATMQTDGRPDTLIVPLIETLRIKGVVTRASCQGHDPDECVRDHERRGSVCIHPGYLAVDARTLDPVSALRVEGPLFSQITCITYPHFVWRFQWNADNRNAAIDCLLDLEPMEGES